MEALEQHPLILEKRNIINCNDCANKGNALKEKVTSSIF